MLFLFRKLRWWLQRNRKEDELREELAFHLAEEASERRVEGVAEQEARWAARRDLGNATIGSTREARRAGTYAATIPDSNRIATALLLVSGSIAPSPNSMR